MQIFGFTLMDFPQTMFLGKYEAQVTVASPRPILVLHTVCDLIRITIFVIKLLFLSLRHMLKKFLQLANATRMGILWIKRDATATLI